MAGQKARWYNDMIVSPEYLRELDAGLQTFDGPSLLALAPKSVDPATVTFDRYIRIAYLQNGDTRIRVFGHAVEKT
jgi:hypothetical protein